MPSPSPACQVKDGAGSYVSAINGVNVTPGHTVTINLVSDAGVGPWSIQCLSTDELSDAAAVNASLVIDSVAKTATFTAPTDGRAYRFESLVNGGIGPDGTYKPSYRTTFCIYTLTAVGNRRVHAVGETNESNATHGWLADFNDLLRNPFANDYVHTPTGTGFVTVTAGVGDPAATANIRYTGGKFQTDANLQWKSGANLGDLSWTPTAARTLTLPDATDTVVGRATTDTLTNKTLTSPTINTPAISGGTVGGATISTSTIDVASNVVTSTGAATGDILVHNGTKFVRVAKGSNNTFLGVDGSGNVGYSAITAVVVDPATNGLRLTTETGVSVSSSNRSAQSTLYLTPHSSGAIALYISGAWATKVTAEINLALSGLTSGKNYDVFAYWTGSVVALELSAAWSSDTARTDAIARQDGAWVKSGTPTRRYVGTIRTTGTTTIEDSQTKRFLWNVSNQVTRSFLVSETDTNSWSGAGTGSFRQVRGQASNKCEIVIGLDTSIVARSCLYAFANATSIFAGSAIGVDSTTASDNTKATTGYRSFSTTGERTQLTASYSGVVALGYHAINWLEIGGSSITFECNANDHSGMHGELAA